MKYKFKARQIVYKTIEVEAGDRETALEEAQRMLEEGEVRFDDESWLEMETDIIQ